MSRIRVLPQTLINQIAAGEVVVNMASVVKELVENSIDAGARHIDVDLANDLRDLTITDDGTGMSRDEAELALQRHATSKIRRSDDLFNLTTRGFRGEALPSIASVSRLEIQTREREALEGTRIVVEGGHIERIEGTGCAQGTRIVIRDLFYNTPARRKFLKSPVSEMNAIVRTLTRQALASNEIGFRLKRDGETKMELRSGESPGERFLQFAGSVEPDDLLDLDFERECPGGTTRVSGFLVHPNTSRGNRSAQYLFVNGRPFSSKGIGAAVEQACKGFIMVQRFPVFCIVIKVPPGEVDINVHPTKEEVRFRDERSVAGACYHAARQALEKSGHVPEMKLGGDEEPKILTPSSGTVVPPRAATQETFLTSPELLVSRAFEKKRARELQQTDWSQFTDERAAAQPAGREFEPAVSSATEDEAPPLDHTSGEPVAPQDRSPVSAGPGEKPDPDFWSRPYDPEPLGQLAWTYIIVRYGEDLLLIDQHAAHERIRYLELQGRRASVASQPLLVPQMIDVPAGKNPLMERLADALKQAGFEVEPFGGRTWQITSVPADLPNVDAPRMVQDLLDEFEETKRAAGVEDLRQRILVRAACHSSIRAGHSLSVEEMRELLRLMRVHQLSFTCPHGRPTVIRLAKGELDRKFGRLH